jgi:hypothetical protein
MRPRALSTKALLEGGAILLQKPFTVQELLQKLREVLDA